MITGQKNKKMMTSFGPRLIFWKISITFWLVNGCFEADIVRRIEDWVSGNIFG